MATAAPGYCSFMSNTISPIARTLKLNGYSTSQFGKCHEVPVWQTSPMGPFDAWPTGGGGFEYFYGFIGGETSQWFPAIYEGTTPVEPEKTPEEGYHFTDDMTTKAIKWIRQQKALMPDKPFFTYFAPGATHAPHHVPKEWADKYKGKFDQGWDKLREETFARQKALGVIPQDCALTERSPGIPAWDSITPEMKPVLAREMEVYAGFLEHTDHHVGRLIDALKDLEHFGRYPNLSRDLATTALRPRARFRVPTTRWSRSLASDIWRRPNFLNQRSTNSAESRLTTTTRWAGRTPWTRPTSGPSRWPRISAAHATR